jgi:hypothetical protein
MKNFIAIVSSSGENVTKYLDFDTQSEADAHVKTHGGFSQKSVGDMIDYYKVADGKATYNNDKITSDNLAKSWASLRQERNIKLAESDWMSFGDSPDISDEWKAYRKSLRDFPSTLNDTTVLNEITWPKEPS